MFITMISNTVNKLILYVDVNRSFIIDLPCYLPSYRIVQFGSDINC